MPRAELRVFVLHRLRRRRVDARRIARVLRAAAAALRVEGELALLLTGDLRIRDLNARYRGKREATDVLSFPGPGGGRQARGAQAAEGAADALLGDVVISVESAERNARRLGRRLADELDLLALHGFLHLLGYDHEADDGTMRRLERRLGRRLLAPRVARGGLSR